LPSTRAIETRSLPTSLAATQSGLAFYVALPESSIPDRDVFYVAEPLSSIRMSPLLIKISKDFATIWNDDRSNRERVRDTDAVKDTNQMVDLARK
jgi:hypothetical protein